MKPIKLSERKRIITDFAKIAIIQLTDHQERRSQVYANERNSHVHGQSEGSTSGHDRAQIAHQAHPRL